jgi:hypothetical protein
MSYTLSETETPTLWQVVYSGRVDAADRHAAVEAGLQASANTPVSGILVDLMNAEVAMSTIAEFMLGQKVSTHPKFQKVRIAFLHRPGAESDSTFLETVEANRGMNTSVHTDRASAMRWLSKGISNKHEEAEAEATGKRITKESADTDQKVREAQIQLLYQQTKISLSGSLIVALTACVVFWQVLPQWKLTLWAGLLILLTLLRGCSIFAFQRRVPLSSDIDRWATLHVIGVTLSALIWTIPIVFLWPAGYPAYQLIWPMIILPMSASAVATYYTWTTSYASFVVLTIVPISLRFFAEGEFHLYVLGLLALLFIFILLRAGKVMHAASVRTFEFGIRNESLNVDLKEVLTLKEQLNAQLQQEITERTLTEQEKEKLIQKLQAALDTIKTLEGVIPICMHCKGIRDDKGSWNQLEAYITEHSDAQFSHGICDDCLKEHYPDVDMKRMKAGNPNDSLNAESA